MATTMHATDHPSSHARLLERDEIKSVLMQERRPILIGKPEEGVSEHRKGKLVLHVVEFGGGVIQGMGREPGLQFIFSQNPFTIHYGVEGSGALGGTMNQVHALIVPGNMRFEIEHTGTTYIGRIAVDVDAGSSISAPVGFTIDNILKHLQGRANKLAVPENWHGHATATGGERMNGQVEKHLVLGPHNQEFSVANNMSPQDFHVHLKLVESYTTFGGMTLFYVAQGKVKSITAGPGESIVVPKGVAHRAEIRGEDPTFVMMASRREIVTDKFLVPGVDHHDPAKGKKALIRLVRSESQSHA